MSLEMATSGDRHPLHFFAPHFFANSVRRFKELAKNGGQKNEAQDSMVERAVGPAE
jgi:hypothetical protein